MKKKGKMAACLILLVLLLAVLVVLTKKNSTADADSSSSDSGADAEKVVDVSKDDNILTLSTCANNNKYRVVLHAKKVNN